MSSGAGGVHRLVPQVAPRPFVARRAHQIAIWYPTGEGPPLSVKRRDDGNANEEGGDTEGSKWSSVKEPVDTLSIKPLVLQAVNYLERRPRDTVSQVV
ncbi:hypothetical protein EYF80_065678 [Liparis tanakae]|uniref:Uncharacterized protein n=1 Tax=Liparis tanakae TaxID=230148 RepID=A0A4Z2E618_9TELE|nr:hypothetical protein EYF80_065678 [Liparis tanakae]